MMVTVPAVPSTSISALSGMVRLGPGGARAR